MLKNLWIKYSEHKFISDMLWTVIATMIVGSSALLIQSFIGHFFEASGLGIYSQVIAIYVILASICSFGMEYSSLKHAAEYSNDHFKLCALYSSSQFIVTLVSFLILGVVLILIFFFPFVFSSVEVVDGIKFILPGVFFFSLNKNSNSFISGLRKIKLYSAVRGVRWILIIILTLIVLLLELDFYYSLIVYSLVEFLLFVFFLFINYPYIKFVYSVEWLRIHFEYGLTNVLTSIINTFNNNFIVLISGYYLTQAETGIIAFMLTFTGIFYVLSSSLQINFNPVFAKKWAEKDLIGIGYDVKKIFQFTSITSIPLFFIAIISYTIFANYWMVDEFNNTTLKFMILSIGTFFIYMLDWPSTMLVLAGKLKQALVRVILISLLTVILSFVMISNFSFLGGLISYTIVSILSIIITYAIIYKSININLIADFTTCWK